MSSGVVKSVEVKDLEDGRFEISYKGFENKLYQLFGTVLLMAAVPTGCVGVFAAAAVNDDGKSGGGLIAIGGLLAAAAAVWLGLWFAHTTHKIIVSGEKLEFGEKKIAFAEIDTMGFEGTRVYVVCSGTRVYLGNAKNPDIAQAVYDRVKTYSKRSWT